MLTSYFTEESNYENSTEWNNTRNNDIDLNKQGILKNIFFSFCILFLNYLYIFNILNYLVLTLIINYLYIFKKNIKSFNKLILFF